LNETKIFIKKEKKGEKASVWPQKLCHTTKQQMKYCIFKALLEFHGHFLFSL